MDHKFFAGEKTLNAAVGAPDAPESSTWTEGYQYTDGLHPTALGAKAMFDQVVKDFPEIKGN